jgi:transposase
VLFEPLLETNPGVRAQHHRPGRPRRRPEKLHADKGYDYPRCRRYLHQRGIKVRIARRGMESRTHLGRVRWVVERSISWLLRFKRLGLRYDRTQHTLRPLLTLACVLINLRRLVQKEF